MHRQKMLKGNTDTLLPLEVGPRLLQIGLITVTTSILMIITAASFGEPERIGRGPDDSRLLGLPLESSNPEF
jgi:hypothetical protein